MTDFYKMTLEEINQEWLRYIDQITKQQADGMPLTERQKRYYHALSKARKQINKEVVK